MKNEVNINLSEFLKAVAQGKNVDTGVVMDSLKEALISAARKYLQLNKRIDVDIDPESNEIRVFLRVEVVDDYPDYDPAMTAAEVEALDECYMLLDDALDFNEDAQPGDLLEMEVPVAAFGRQAIQTAKQFLIQKVRDAERNKVFEIYRDRVGALISGEVLRIEQNKNVIVSIGKHTEAVLTPREQIQKERWAQGDSIKAVIADVGESSKGGAQVILSRANGAFLRELFRQEVPEIYEGTVEIKGIARDPGFRAKIAVVSREERIDPVGACVGMKGQRVQAIVRELANERIDIVHWDPDISTYIRRALSPANIIKMIDVTNTRRTVIIVADEDLAQSIGRNGQNVRLASQLVGRDLDVFGEKEWAEKNDDEKQKVLTPRSNEGERRGATDNRGRFSSLDSLFRKEDEGSEGASEQSEEQTSNEELT